MSYIKIVKQDKVNGVALDTEVKIDVVLVVEGSSLGEFEKEMDELICKYRI